MGESVLIVGAGSGLSASLARLCNNNGMKIVLASRNVNFSMQIKLKLLKLKSRIDLLDKGIEKIRNIFNIFYK